MPSVCVADSEPADARARVAHRAFADTRLLSCVRARDGAFTRVGARAVANMMIFDAIVALCGGRGARRRSSARGTGGRRRARSRVMM